MWSFFDRSMNGDASFWRYGVRRSICGVAEGLALPPEGALAKVDARGASPPGGG